MISEEIALNEFHLPNRPCLTVVETDLGEYIIQLRVSEPPSHIIAPAVHVSERAGRAGAFRAQPTQHLPADRSLSEPQRDPGE